MASIAAFPTLYSPISRFHSKGFSNPSSSTTPFPLLRFRRVDNIALTTTSCHYLTKQKKKPHERLTRIRAVAEETMVSEEEDEQVVKEESSVSVPVLPSDMLTMFFQAEGIMSESIIPSVSKALEDIEGVSDVKVQILEGIASVELAKQTTVQATGVASNLVEIIQGCGFKLQTLNLSFKDEEDTTN